MDHLSTFATRGSVQEIIDAAIEQRGVHGVGLSSDPRWLVLERASHVLEPPELDELESWYTDYPLHRWPGPDRSEPDFLAHLSDPHSWYRFGPRMWGALSEAIMFPHKPVDPDYRPARWREFSQTVREFPFVVTVLISPEAALDPEELRSRLQGIAEADGNYVVVVEWQQEGSLSATVTSVGASNVVGGDRLNNVTAGGSGTVGSLVRSIVTGSDYFATAGHVASFGDAVEVWDNLQGIGQPQPGSCAQSLVGLQLVAPLTGAQRRQGLPDVDFGLASTASQLPTLSEVDGIGRIHRITPEDQVQERAVVTTSGSRSGTQQLRIGELWVVKSLLMGSVRYAFRDLIALQRLSRLWGLSGTLQRPTRPGDSGGWVVLEKLDGTNEWLGVITGNEGARSYACYAHRAAAAARVSVV